MWRTIGEKLSVLPPGYYQVRLNCHEEWDETADL